MKHVNSDSYLNLKLSLTGIELHHLPVYIQILILTSNFWFTYDPEFSNTETK